MSKPKTQWSFSAQIERFEGESEMHLLAIPNDLVDDIKSRGKKRYVITVNDAVTWHCGLLGTGDGRWSVMMAKEKLKRAQTAFGGWVHVDFKVDDSKYGMPVPPDLQDMFDDDPEFLNRFDALLPGKRRNALHHIASAKTDATIAKRILKLMNDLGLIWAAALLLCASLSACGQQENSAVHQAVRMGNAQTEIYLPLLLDKDVAVVGNHTSVVDGVHLVDTLLSSGVNVVHVFAPEHGFRGEAANGADIQDGIDAATGLKVHSLHGKHKKPQPEHLEGINVVVFDIQDVGARFYTFISSMMLVMEACAEHGVEMVILDRPNPHGHHMQGPMLEPEFKSFVGFVPVPMVHGLTLGEVALMACGEGWIEVPSTWRPTVVPCEHWSHGDDVMLGIRPSPNLPTTAAIDLYPSLCLFEPTAISVGRGTDAPFEQLGHPEVALGDDAFTPRPIPGAAPHPKHDGTLCQGQRLTQLASEWRQEAELQNAQEAPGFSLKPLWAWAEAWRQAHDGTLDGFITSPSFFDKLAGTDAIRLSLEANEPLAPLEQEWKTTHLAFFASAQLYFLYPWNGVWPTESSKE